MSGRSEDHHTTSVQRRRHYNLLAERNKLKLHKDRAERPDYRGFKSLDLLAVRRQNIRATLGPVGVKFVTYTMQKKSVGCSVHDLLTSEIALSPTFFFLSPLSYFNWNSYSYIEGCGSGFMLLFCVFTVGGGRERSAQAKARQPKRVPAPVTQR